MIGSAVKKIQGFSFKSITPDQSKDTGMAMVLIFLLLAFCGGGKKYAKIFDQAVVGG